MPRKVALQIAIDLVHIPSQVRFVRSAPLPDGVPALLRIAAGDEEAELAAARSTHRSRETVRRAAIFFIEQILFAPCADSYRVLGASSHASARELRENFALLLKWLHPDCAAQDGGSIFNKRVTAAWNDLKTPERRAAYDQRRREVESGGKLQSVGAQNDWVEQSGRSVHAIVPRRRDLRGQPARGPRRRQRIGLLRLVLSALFQRPPS